MQLPHQILNYLSEIFYSFNKISFTNTNNPVKFFVNLANNLFINRYLLAQFN